MPRCGHKRQPLELRPAERHKLMNLFSSPQSSSHAGDQELVARMKSLEVENHTLHKGVFACQKSGVVILETSIQFSLPVFVSGGDLERNTAEAGGQSGRAGKEPCTDSCPLR